MFLYREPNSRQWTPDLELEPVAMQACFQSIGLLVGVVRLGLVERFEGLSARLGVRDVQTTATAPAQRSVGVGAEEPVSVTENQLLLGVSAERALYKHPSRYSRLFEHRFSTHSLSGQTILHGWGSE